VLAAWPRLRQRPGFASSLAIAAELGVALCLLAIDRVALDPLAIASDPLQFARLMLYYVAVALPFFAGGFLVAVPLMAHPASVSRLYFWDLIGAGLACGAVVPLIWWLGTPIATALSTAGFAFAAIAYAEPLRRLVRGLLALLGAALALVVAATGTFEAAPTKFVSQFLANPNAQLAFARWTPINRVDVVRFEPAPTVGSYIGWGISPNYAGGAPPYWMIGNDGDSCAVMYGWDGDPAALDFLGHHVLAAPYLLLDRPSVAAIGLGGGADVLNALRAGARAIVGIEINPMTVLAGRELFRDWNGDILNRPGVEAVVAEGRSFLRSRDTRYDLIEINSVDTLSALSTGAYVLSESFLYTSDAVSDYLAHLRPNGIFAMAVGDLNSKDQPPRHTLRLASIVRRALEQRGVAQPERHVIVIASPGGLPLTHTLVKNEPFTAGEIAKIETFALREGFELWQRPDQPVAHLTSKILRWPPRELASFYARHPLKLGPTTDDSPFFFNFYKWRTLAQSATYAQLGYDRTLATGQIVLVIMLAQAVVMSALLILLPLRRVPRATGGTWLQRAGLLVYFAALGTGFILLEISLIQRFVLFLGYPTYSLTVVMLSLLVSTGIGSLRTERVTSRFESRLPLRLLLLAGLAAALVYGAPFAFEQLLGAPLALRIAVSIALLAPLGLVLGGFFPLGIRVAERANPRLVPWAWAVNGCATVIGTLVAVIAGMSSSFTIVTGIALGVYAVGVFALLVSERGVRGLAAD
jgi:SAM-dependent methyltransferase